MAASGYAYCWKECALPWLAEHKEFGIFRGVVGIDHEYTNQGMPCVDGIPMEFEHQDMLTRQLKVTFPGIRVLQYRITDAVPYSKVVHDKMTADPEAFVRWPNGSVCQMPYAESFTTGYNCSWPIKAAAYNWTLPRVRKWFLDHVVKRTLVYGDGPWLDGDGPGNGAWMCSGSWNYTGLQKPYPPIKPQQIAAFCEGETQVVNEVLEWLIPAGGYHYNCFTFVTSGLPLPDDTPAQCASKLKDLDHKTFSPSNAVVLYGSRLGAEGYNSTTVSQAVATFMLTRGDYWWMGVPAADTLDPTVAHHLLTDFGAPLGNMTQASNGVFQRKFEHAIVQLDCNTFTASFDLC